MHADRDEVDCRRIVQPHQTVATVVNGEVCEYMVSGRIAYGCKQRLMKFDALQVACLLYSYLHDKMIKCMREMESSDSVRFNGHGSLLWPRID